MRMAIGLVCGSFIGIAPRAAGTRTSCPRLGACASQPADHRLAAAMKDAIPPGRIANDLRAIERWTKHGGVGDLPAQTAADAALDHGCHRIAAQRIGVGLDRERGTAGEPDAGMVAGANLIIDAEAYPDHALAAFEHLGIFRSHAALARQLAFAVGDDD